MPLRIIATKHDKVKKSTLNKRKNDLADGCGVERKDVRWVSAAKGVGIPELRNEIHSFLTNEPEDDEQ